jgi:ketosteroid isomerase-like protein
MNMMDPQAAAERWARQWEAGWRAHDIDAIAALYAEECVFRSAPLRPAHMGRAGIADYARWAFGDERDPDPRFGAPIVAGNRAVVEYWCTLTDPHTARPVTIAGCALLRFDADGLVVEQHDYWHQEDGTHAPHDVWGT